MNTVNNQSANALMRDVIQRVAVGPDRGKDIPLREAEQVMQAMLAGQIGEVQIAVFLIALRMKRESLDECRGLFNAMQNGVTSIKSDVPELVCLADPFDGYVRHVPMSPFLPAVLAACEFPALMHGVKSVGPKYGVTACKVYELAGMDVFQPSVKANVGLLESGWAYLDQSQYAPQLFAFNKLRDKIVKRTALTTLERLIMPIKAQNKTHLVLGYVHKAYPQIYAAVAQLAGYHTALLIKGVEGGLMPALNKPLRRTFFDVASLSSTDFDLAGQLESKKEVIEMEFFENSTQAAHTVNQESKSDPTQACLDLGLAVLSGKQGTARDSLSLASAQILFAHQRASSMTAAIDIVYSVLDSGKALAIFNSRI